jgi:hypothetical protein
MLRMAVRRRHLTKTRARGAFAAVTLVGHLFAVIGFPLPSVRSSQVPNDVVQYPCASRGCGCGSADECWKGDCCCFTLEEKLAWADERGIEPPAHVRPMVEARKNRASSHGTRPTKTDCCAKENEHQDAEGDCPECRRNAASKSASLTWTVGPMTAKCQGLGAAPGAAFPPATVQDRVSSTIIADQCIGTILPTSQRVISSIFSPPTPPPRPDASSL